MPNPYTAYAESNTGQAGTTAAMLAVAYELKTQNLLRAAEIENSAAGQALLNDVRNIRRERLS